MSFLYKISTLVDVVFWWISVSDFEYLYYLVHFHLSDVDTVDAKSIPYKHLYQQQLFSSINSHSDVSILFSFMIQNLLF
jgi:hypothetical protein